MLIKDQISEIAFGEYENLLQICRREFSSISKNGIPPEEIVNQAIISVFDVKTGFESKETLIGFLKNNLKNVFFHEKQAIETTKYLIKSTKSNRHINLVEEFEQKKTTGPSKEFNKIYSIFERARFSEGKVCPRCGSSNVQIMNCNTPYKCASCFKHFSITSGTTFDNGKLGFLRMYRAVATYARCPEISSVLLSRWIGCTQTTAYYLKKKIQLSSYGKKFQTPLELLQICLTAKQEKVSIKKLKTGVKKSVISKDDYLNIFRLSERENMHKSQISEIYGVTTKHIERIIDRVKNGHIHRKSNQHALTIIKTNVFN